VTRSLTRTEGEKGGRSPSGRAVVNGAGQAVSALRASVPSAFSEVRDDRKWLHPDDMPPFDQRPSRQFILVEGFREHSGHLWHRVWADVAFIRRDDQPDSSLGYRVEDIGRIMRDGDMDCAERIIGWLPAAFPYFNAIAPAQAIEARRAETGTGSVEDESAVVEDHAPEGSRP
jgi:hypothetical protein